MNTDPTQPGYYQDRAPENEHQLRADFARHYQACKQYVADPSEATPQQYWDTDLDLRWRDGADLLSAYQWRHLSLTTYNWESLPKVMADQLDQDLNDAECISTVDEIRNQFQARELTGNGGWEPDPESVCVTAKSGTWFAVAAGKVGDTGRVEPESGGDPVPHWYGMVTARHPDHPRSAHFGEAYSTEAATLKWAERTSSVFAYPKFPGTQVEVHVYEVDEKGGDREAYSMDGPPIDVAEQIGRWQTELEHRDSGTAMNAFAAAAAVENEREGAER